MAKNNLLGRSSEFKQVENFQKVWKVDQAPKLFVITGPAGVGRTSFLTAVLEDQFRDHSVCRISLLEDSCFRSLSKKLGRGLRADGTVQFSEVIAAWHEHFGRQTTSKPVLLVLEDLQELEEVEQNVLIQWLQGLLSGSLPVWVLLEYRDTFDGLPLQFDPQSYFQIQLAPLNLNDVEAWLRNVTGLKNIPSETAMTLLEKTGGLPLALTWWINYLTQNSKKKFPVEVIKAWPENDAELTEDLMKTFNEQEVAVLQCLQLHPSWVTVPLVSTVTGISQQETNPIFVKFLERDYIAKDSSEQGRFLLRFRTLGETVLNRLSVEQKRFWHQKCFQFLKVQRDWLFLSTWLAWHGAQSGLSRQAYGSNLLAGEFFEVQGQNSVALAYVQRALEFAQDPFRRAYGLFRLGETAMAAQDFIQATQALQECYAGAQKIPWPELVLMAAGQLGELYKYLGRYAEAEFFFTTVLAEPSPFTGHRPSIRLSLGHCLLEQAKYSDAGNLFTQLLQVEDSTLDPEYNMAIRLGLLQVSIALGRFTEALEKIEALESQLTQEHSQMWKPLLLMLRGKVLIIQGELSQSIKVLEQAAQAFEAFHDIYGKVEVLLSMSAPLLEHNLVHEAEKILNLLSNWHELPEIPALGHSVRLRRLAVAAFMGKYRQEDLKLANQDPYNFGRLEDWLQFWFHLALAGMTRKNTIFFQQFVAKALSIAKTVASRLTDADRQSFLRRPDIARIFRLSGEEDLAGKQQIRSDRSSETTESVDAATLAPPIRDLPDSENE